MTCSSAIIAHHGTIWLIKHISFTFLFFLLGLLLFLCWLVVIFTYHSIEQNKFFIFDKCVSWTKKLYIQSVQKISGHFEYLELVVWPWYLAVNQSEGTLLSIHEESLVLFNWQWDGIKWAFVLLDCHIHNDAGRFWGC